MLSVVFIHMADKDVSVQQPTIRMTGPVRPRLRDLAGYGSILLHDSQMDPLAVGLFQGGKYGCSATTRTLLDTPPGAGLPFQ